MKYDIIILDNGEEIEVPEEATQEYDINELIEFIGYKKAVVAFEGKAGRK